MAGPLRKEEVETLERISRKQLDMSQTDDTILGRLVSLGLVEERRGNYTVTSRGAMELTRRKSVSRTSRR